MIPNIDGTYYPTHRRLLPDTHDDDDRFALADPSLFATISPPLRKMVVMVDADLVSGTSERSQERVLTAMVSHPFIHCYRYSEAGPPKDVDILGTSSDVEGWIHVDDRTASPGSTTSSDGVRRTFEYYSIAIRYWDGSALRQESVRHSTESDDDARGHTADIVASKTAGVVGVDAYITEREYLHTAKRWLRRYVAHYPSAEPPCYNVREALALVGLYLRTQGAHTLQLPVPGLSATVRKQFYWRGARVLLPGYWRWHKACEQYSNGTHDNSTLSLSDSLRQRLEHALWYRDTVHRGLNQPEDAHSTHDVFASLQSCLVLLMGALDACARVCHHVVSIKLGLQSSKPEIVGWQRRGWLKLVERKYPALASLVMEGSPGRSILTILTSLRNTIHGEDLLSTSSSLVGISGFRPLLRIPRAKEVEVRRAVCALGNLSDWGVVEDPSGLTADPGLFLEQLFPQVVSLLNDLMDGTPVEDLPHVSLTQEDHRPPKNSAPSGQAIDSLRWQLGL